MDQLSENIEQNRRWAGTSLIIQASLTGPDFTAFHQITYPFSSLTVAVPLNISVSFTQRVDGLGRAVNNGDGAAGDADEFAAFVGDANVPDVGGAPPVQGRGGGDQAAIAFGAQVVGIDLQTKGGLPFQVAVQRGPQRGGRFRQHQRSSTMQIARLLAMTGANRHAQYHKVFFSGHNGDIKRLPDRPLAGTVEQLYQF